MYWSECLIIIFYLSSPVNFNFTFTLIDMKKMFLLTAVVSLMAVTVVQAQKKPRPAPTPKELKATVSLDKANVLYVSVNNPVTLTAGNAVPDDIIASCKKGRVDKDDNGNRTIYCERPGLDTLEVFAPDGTAGKFSFKVKKLPDPAARLNGEFSSGSLTVDELRSCTEISTVYDNPMFTSKCPVSGFNFTYIPKKQEPVSIVSTSAKFDAKIAAQIVKAKAGDYYMFSNISSKCPGDPTPRILAPIVILVK